MTSRIFHSFRDQWNSFDKTMGSIWVGWSKINTCINKDITTATFEHFYIKSVKCCRDSERKLPVQLWREVKNHRPTGRVMLMLMVMYAELNWHEQLTSVWSPCCQEISVSMGRSGGTELLSRCLPWASWLQQGRGAWQCSRAQISPWVSEHFLISLSKCCVRLHMTSLIM